MTKQKTKLELTWIGKDNPPSPIRPQCLPVRVATQTGQNLEALGYGE